MIQVPRSVYMVSTLNKLGSKFINLKLTLYGIGSVHALAKSTLSSCFLFFHGLREFMKWTSNQDHSYFERDGWLLKDHFCQEKMVNFSYEQTRKKSN